MLAPARNLKGELVAGGQKVPGKCGQPIPILAPRHSPSRERTKKRKNFSYYSSLQFNNTLAIRPFTP
jgi:hypothetical protein